eukprot:TRINITY_DN356_c0_g1_i11.p1 TRINITY_DN356_c0_g1~~TRINITY_DN356_c0_g1_i11.p1  ORF type:complete len:118 (+),score=17.53 TRINITY_DN356_c0_g1_i11:997-1350(+)
MPIGKPVAHLFHCHAWRWGTIEDGRVPGSVKSYLSGQKENAENEGQTKFSAWMMLSFTIKLFTVGGWSFNAFLRLLHHPIRMHWYWVFSISSIFMLFELAATGRVGVGSRLQLPKEC